MDSEPMPDTESEEPSLGVIFQEVKDAIRIQVDQFDKLDAKIGLILAAAGVSLAVVLSNGFLPPEGKRLTSVLQLPGVMAIVLSAVCAVRALWPRAYYFAPSPRHLKTEYLAKDDHETSLKLLDAWIESHEKNDGIINRKALWTKLSASLLATGLFLVALTFVYNSVGVLP